MGGIGQNTYLSPGSGTSRDAWVAERLEDARWPLADALEAAARLRAVIRQADAILGELVMFQRQAHGAQLEVARAYGATHFREQQLHRIDGLTIAPRKRPSVFISEEEQLRIVVRRAAGETMAAIGDGYNVSRQRIAQILDRQNRNGGSK